MMRLALIVGKNIKVPFQPKEGRPVYCESCLKKTKTGQKENHKGLDQAITDSLVNLNQPKVIQPGEVIKFHD